MRREMHVMLVGVAILMFGGCGDRSTDPAQPAVVMVDPVEPAPTVSEAGPGSIYAVAEYDAERDPAQDLAQTVQQATASDKRILLEVGGQW